MTRLTLLLIVKIAFTAIAVAIPFLLLPPDRVATMVNVEVPAPLLYRLYGVAILALLVGYASAIPQSQRGELPRGIVAMGLVSNAGAATTLLAFGAAGVTLALATIFAVIAVLLAVTLVAPATMLRPLRADLDGEAQA